MVKKTTLTTIPENYSLWIFANQLPYYDLEKENLDIQGPILMVENPLRASKYAYHKMKLLFIYSIMREFKQTYEKQFYIDYYNLKQKINFEQALVEHLTTTNNKKIVTYEPLEYQTLHALERIEKKHNIEILLLRTRLFLVSKEEFQKWARNKKNLVMEYFYRYVRKKYKILIDEKEKPVGGKWNYDKENRLKYTSEIKPGPVNLCEPTKITEETKREINEFFPNNPGSVENFYYPTTRKQSILHLENFVESRLDLFGPYEDMMAIDEPHLYHSVISPLINVGLLTPKEIIREVLEAYDDNKARLNSVEAMIRQIMGWREFMFGLYWLKMPGFAKSNYFNFNRNLPNVYYTGNTKLECLKQNIMQIKREGYTHHIPRLMVLSNFALLNQTEPSQVFKWFMEYFIDAYDWVMVPNVYGMGLFADGGETATKPYISSSNYINKMSNYCSKCEYKQNKTVDSKACPFNYLYWNFLIENKSKLKDNNRMRLMYKLLEKKTTEEKEEIQKMSRGFLKYQK